jgi:hypothetical protein
MTATTTRRTILAGIAATTIPTAAIATPTATADPDAWIFQAIDRVAALYAEAEPFADVAPSEPNYQACEARRSELCFEAYDWEWDIATAEVSTPTALAAKIRAIKAAGFDQDDMPAILDGLAADAERIAAAA